MDFWNKKDLNGPPVLNYISKQRLLNLPEFTSHFSNGIHFTSNDGLLKQEAALLSRIIYKMKCKFSKDKFLNAMQKTNKALILYLQLDVQTILTSYKDSIPTRYEQETYFPTIDMLDFILVRLQGACKLLIRIRDSARTAALYLGDKLIIGHFWKVTLLCLGIVSRIAQVGNQICRYFSNLYDVLLKYRPHFKNAGEKWLPDNYPFPLSMQTWLDVEFDVSPTSNLQTYDLSLAESVKAYNYLSSIPIETGSDTDDVELVDEYFDLDDNVRSKKHAITNINSLASIQKVAEPIFIMDSDEDDHCSSYGVEVDEFGNPLDSGANTNIDRNKSNELSRDIMQRSSTFESFSKSVTNKRGTYKRNADLEKVIAKIFRNPSATLKKSKLQMGPSQISKKNKKPSRWDTPKSNAQKQNYEIRNVYLNLKSKHDFYEFLNEQQKMLSKKKESCIFSHLNKQRFIKLRKQIHYVLHILNLPKEEIYEKCREILYENMDTEIQRIE